IISKASLRDTFLGACMGSPKIKRGFRNLNKSLKLFGPTYAAGTIGALERPAMVTAPRFKGTSSLVLVPLGKIPTSSPSLIKLRGILIELGPGFSRSTGIAFNFCINHFTGGYLNNSLLDI